MSEDTDLHLYDRVKAIVSQHREAKADGAISLGEVTHILGDILEAAAHVLHGLTDGREHAAVLAESCERLFDEYLRPLDIKGIPNLIEPTVDGLIRAQIRPLILGLVDHMEG